MNYKAEIDERLQDELAESQRTDASGTPQDPGAPRQNGDGTEFPGR
ncbi:hypothetical protein L1277_000377 [Okibacterium sp. HSC-33S16]|nr:hypothetical protein [Okibacterium sp. HSC-33S16]MCP2030313.1 hypothetical protein [Okibacterium sp. HSC-33S16]